MTISQEQQEAMDRLLAVQAIQELMTRNTGLPLIKYLFKHLRVGEVPQAGLPSEFLNSECGELRAGAKIFDLVSEADPAFAGKILATIRQEKDQKNVQEILSTLRSSY